jgi:hypothetical protein
MFKHAEIIAETSRSWVLMDVGSPDWQRLSTTKLPKNLKGYEIGTQEQAEQKRWAIKNVWKISQRVQNLCDPILICKIAALIGYMEEK